MPNFSLRTHRLQASPIREILAVIDRPGMVSFAGGLPASESFPELATDRIPRGLLQYGPCEGEFALRSQICSEMKSIGLNCDTRQVLVLSGSQQGIDLVAKLLLDPGSVVAAENPTYLAALQVFNLFGADYVSLDPASPETMVSGLQQPTMAYCIPTFRNPAGDCYTLAQRLQLAGACMENDIVLFEDDPYRDLVYDDCERRPVCSFMTRGSWIYQGSFSKSFAPGLRLGFLVCSPDLVQYLTRLKQAADLHSNRLSQYLILKQLLDPDRNSRMQQLQQQYRKKRDAFDAALREHFADLANWQTPAGGLFFWLQLKNRTDTSALLQQAIAADVAFMPGEPFLHTPDPHHSFLRLNFSHASEADMHRGLQTLGRLLRQSQPISAAA